MHVHDLTHQRFGRLRVIERAENATDGHAQWLCECDCNKRVIVTSQSLVCNKTLSCGCYRKEVSSEIGKRHKGVKRNGNLNNKSVQICTSDI